MRIRATWAHVYAAGEPPRLLGTPNTVVDWRVMLLSFAGLEPIKRLGLEPT